MTDDRRAVVDAWIAAQTARDWAAARALYAPEVVVDWPQTGERIVGIANVIEADRSYPGGLPDASVHRVIGSEDRWLIDASFVPRRIVGSGDVWTLMASMSYPSGERWEWVGVLELRDGRIVRQTELWAPLGEPPAWRAHLVERTG